MTSKQRAVCLADERLKTTGTSFEKNEEELRNCDTLPDKLVILGATLAAEMIFLTQACKNLSINKLIIGTVASYFLADLFAGIPHFISDTIDWKNPNVPNFLKKQAILAQFHHDSPQYWNKLTYWQLSRSLYLANFTLLGGSAVSSFYGCNMCSFILALTALFSAQAHYTHALAHRPQKDTPLVMKFLQKYGIIESWESHKMHHRPPHDTHFCSLSGHMNKILDPMILAGRATHRFLKGTRKKD